MTNYVKHQRLQMMLSCILSSEEWSKVMQIIEKREFEGPRKKCYSVSLKNELWKRNGCPNQLIIQTTSEASVKLQVPKGRACQLFSSCGTPKSYGFWRKKSQTPSSYKKGNMQTCSIACFYLNIVVKNSYLSLESCQLEQVWLFCSDLINKAA